MDFGLTQEQEALRREIVEFARSALNEGARERDQECRFDRGVWSRCGEAKLTGLAVPIEYGGRGLDSLSTALALEAFGYGCVDGGLVFAVSAHMLAAAVPLWKHGNDAQRREVLPKLCGGSAIAAIAMTEPESGSDVYSLATRAVAEGDGFRIHGTKTLITNAPVADVAIVFALTDENKGFHGGITAFLVDLKSPGILRSEPIRSMSVRSCAVGELRFDNTFVPASGVLGSVGGGASVFTTAMDWERTCLFATHIGTMERLLETAIRFAKTRRIGGQPIGKFQSVANRLVDSKVRLEAARLLVYRAAWRLEHSRTPSMDAAMAKLFTSESHMEGAIDAVRIHGGRGLEVDRDVERALRDAIACTIYSGTSDIQRNIIARWLGL
jgi:alkylation response protein AidB-like acyl-CoA dehydrogenase